MLTVSHQVAERIAPTVMAAKRRLAGTWNPRERDVALSAYAGVVAITPRDYALVQRLLGHSGPLTPAERATVDAERQALERAARRRAEWRRRNPPWKRRGRRASIQA